MKTIRGLHSSTFINFYEVIKYICGRCGGLMVSGRAVLVRALTGNIVLCF